MPIFGLIMGLFGFSTRMVSLGIVLVLFFASTGFGRVNQDKGTMKSTIRYSVIAVCAAAAIFGLASCSDPFMPVLPNWDVPMNVPFASQKITVRDLVEQDTSIMVNIGLDGTITATLRSCVYIDTIKYTLKPDVVEKLRIADNGKFVFDLENHLPVDAVIEPAVLDENYQTLFVPKLASGAPMRIAPAVVVGDNEAINPVKSRIEVTLSNSDFHRIIEGTYVMIRLTISTTGRMPVLLTLNDYIRLQTYAKVTITSDVIL